MPPLTTLPLHFGPHLVTSQIFHLTPLSYALVNLKPLLPGHVLICPRRVVPRLKNLTSAETVDFFATVQRVSRVIERVYGADALNVAIQDGRAAGQSVEHVHCHVIPRKMGDMDARGGGDKVYEMLEGEEGDLERAFRARSRGVAKPDAERVARGEEEMRVEAEWLAGEMAKEEEGEGA